MALEGGCPRVHKLHHCVTSTGMDSAPGGIFHNHIEPRKAPALVDPTQHFGAADSLLSPLDGYLLLSNTVSAPTEHQLHFCSFCAAFPSQPAGLKAARQALKLHFYLTHIPTSTIETRSQHLKSKSNPSLGAKNISCFEHCCDYTVRNRADQHRPKDIPHTVI